MKIENYVSNRRTLLKNIGAVSVGAIAVNSLSNENAVAATTDTQQIPTEYGYVTPDMFEERDYDEPLQAALTFSVENKIPLKLNSRVYTSTKKLISPVGDIMIFGEGNAGIIFTTQDGGLVCNLNAQGSGVKPNILSLNNFFIETQTDIPFPGITANWSNFQPNAQGQAWINRIRITRKDDGTGSFTSGIKLINAIVGEISECILLGDDSRKSKIGMEFINCVGIRVNKCDINRYAKGVKIAKDGSGNSEGIFFTDCFIYDIYNGVDVNSSLHVNLINTHVNINGTDAKFSIKFSDCSQCAISAGSLIYFGGRTGDALNQDGVQIINSNGISIGGDSKIIGLNIQTTRYGVAYSGSSTYNSLTSVTVSFAGNAGVIYGSINDSFNINVGNKYFNNYIDYSDSGSQNIIALNSDEEGLTIGSLKWGKSSGKFGNGEISADANWGAYIKGHSGIESDLAFVDSSGNIPAYLKHGALHLKNFTKSSLPPVTSGGIIMVVDDIGGFTLAFSDGTKWRRVADRAIIA